jgi:hypothetical protein
MEPSLVGSFFKMLGHLIGIKVQRDELRIAAGIEFRNAFAKQLVGLYPSPSDWPKGTGIEHKLKAVYPALENAVTAFRPFVPKRERAKFDRAWLLFYSATKREGDHSYLHYLNFNSTWVSQDSGYSHEMSYKTDGKKNFKRNVKRVLSFAGDA